VGAVCVGAGRSGCRGAESQRAVGFEGRSGCWKSAVRAMGAKEGVWGEDFRIVTTSTTCFLGAGTALLKLVHPEVPDTR